MKNFQDKKESSRIIKSWPFIILLFILTIFLIYGLFEFTKEMRETNKNKEIAENKVRELRERKEKLILDIDNLNTDEGKEKIFRENFGLGKEGEELIVIIDEKKNLKEEIIEKKNFFDFFKNLFK